MNCMLDTKVPNITKYIPVDDATLGWTPNCSIRGLKITPPPSPTKLDAVPPISKKDSWLNFTEYNWNSKPYQELQY